MKDIKPFMLPITAGTLSLFAVASVAADAQSAPKKPDATWTPVEQQTNAAKVEGDRAIDKDAVSAIDEALKAVKSISDGKSDQALAAIERATGKINILLARKPAIALIPVRSEVAIIDLAPTDRELVGIMADAARSALSSADYAKARYLLDQLASEVHIKTYHLPLATYSAALQSAARSLDEHKPDEAKQLLLTALGTLVVVDQVRPLPLIAAQQAIKDAQQKRDQDKPAARKLLGTAKEDLDRAKQLGYANKDPDYASLNQSITNLDKQLSGTESTSSGFAALREKMSAFFDRISHNEQEIPQQTGGKSS